MSYDPTSTMRTIVRNNADNGWIVQASFRTKEFLDLQPDNTISQNNSYVNAFNYAFSLIDVSKRKHATERNFVYVEKLNRKKEFEKFIRITRPMGGYKFFKIIPMYLPNLGKTDYTLTSLETAIHEANSWFAQERAKCQEAITLKNIENTKTRRKKLHSFLFGDPSLGLL